jgi:hypothetical protein
MGVLRRAARDAWGSAFLRRDLRAAVLPWLVARVLVVGSLAVARSVFADIGSGPRPAQLGQGLFAWDAAFYRDIAEHGYAAVGRPSLRFFPLFPLLGRWLGFVFADHTAVALILLVNVSALVLGALLHRLVVQETGDEQLATRAAWFIAVFPPAAALVMGYAEATAMALAVGVFLAMRTRRWLVAALLGYLVGLARPVGVLLVVPLVIEAARDWRTIPGAERVRRVVAVVAPVGGAATYLVWAGARFGDAFEPITYQNRSTLRGGFVDPFSRVVDAISELLDGRAGPIVHVAWAAGFLVLALVVARRLPLSYAAYGVITVLVALSAHNLDSLERYAMSAFPLIIGLAFLTAHRDLERVALALAAAGLVGYSVVAFLGIAVP